MWVSFIGSRTTGGDGSDGNVHPSRMLSFESVVDDLGVQSCKQGRDDGWVGVEVEVDVDVDVEDEDEKLCWLDRVELAAWLSEAPKMDLGCLQIPYP